MLPISLMFFVFGQQVYAEDFHKPPIELPFHPNKVGGAYAFNADVTEQLTYSVDIRFYIARPNKYSHFFDKDSPEDAKRLADILGGPRNVAMGEWVEPGVPAKFRVQIIQKTDNKPVLDELVDHPKTSATYAGRYTTLASKNLPIGAYTIRIEYLDGAPELAPLHARILFARAHHGK